MIVSAGRGIRSGGRWPSGRRPCTTSWDTWKARAFQPRGSCTPTAEPRHSPGSTASPAPTAGRTSVPETGLRRWARFLRRYHDAVAGYRPPASSVWSSGTGTCAPGEIICHGDFGPWNGVWRDGEVAGLIDWDHARPAPPLFDVAYALEYAAPFRDDTECVRWLRYPAPPPAACSSQPGRRPTRQAVSRCSSPG